MREPVRFTHGFNLGLRPERVNDVSRLCSLKACGVCHSSGKGLHQSAQLVKPPGACA